MGFEGNSWVLQSYFLELWPGYAQPLEGLGMVGTKKDAISAART